MSRAFIGGCYLAFMTSAAAGETVLVRGGEHEEFTRLVLDLPRTVGWSIDETDGVHLHLEELQVDFEIGAALQKLNSNRIKSLKQLNGTADLQIDLNCECEVKSFYAGSTMLVVDIYGADKKPAKMADAAVVVSEVLADKVEPEAIEHHFVLPLFPNIPRVAQLSPKVPADLASDRNHLITEASRLHETEQRLLQQMSRVASQGLLEPEYRLISPPPTEEKPAETKADSSTQPERLHLPDPAGFNMRAISSIDRDLILSSKGPRYSVNGVRCMADSRLAVQDWVGSDSFTEMLGALRRELVGEFDKRSTEASVSLAKAYIGYGLGAEAAFAVEGLQLSESNQYLLAMADIVEDGVLSGSVPPGWYTDCDGAAALWAVFAVSSLPNQAAINDDAILRSFSALQPAVRAHLGPSLFAKLQDHNQISDTLPRLLTLMRRGRDAIDPGVQLASADHALAIGDESSAHKAFNEVIEANGEDAPEALIEKINALANLKQPIPARLQELAEAYAKEYHRDALGVRLSRANVLALASAHSFSKAFSQLNTLGERHSDVDAESAASYVLAALVSTPDDIIFLTHIFELPGKGYALEVSVENIVAKRLINLGFSEQAEQFLSSAALGEAGRARRLLRAEAALGQSKPRRAEAELLGLTGIDVEKLRLRARLLNGDHNGARISFATLGENELAAEQAWLGSNWDELVAMETESWRAEQDAVEAGIISETSPDKVLTIGHGLLGTSSGLRAELQALLSRHEITNALPVN